MGTAALLAVTSSVVLAQSQPFPVCLKRTGSNDCESNDTTATHMGIDPASGRVTLQGVEGLGSGLPGGASGLGNISWSITPPNPATSGDNVTVIVQNIPAGASCEMRPITTQSGSGSAGGDGWTAGTQLPLNGAGTASLPRNLALSASTAGWELKLNVQCSIATNDGYFVYGPVMSSPSITVPPSQIIVTGDCPYVDGNGDMVPPGHDGLTMASRQTSINVLQNGYQGNGNKDASLYTNLFGVHVGGVTIGGRPVGTPGDLAQGYGYPGTYGNNFVWRIDTGKFVALKFRAPSTPDWKGVASTVRTYSPTTNSTPVSWAIAPCPGQFRSVQPGVNGVPLGAPAIDLPPACVDSFGGTKGSGVMTIVSDPNDPYPIALGKCPLTMGKTYYINIMAVDPEPIGNLNPATPVGSNQWWCLTQSCTVNSGRLPLTLDPVYH
ncbi:MAG TPA: hypothetical protein PKO41_04535 [Dokdonella sp.]|nr:hypothetical protein [Dokdonella sp.]